MELFRKIFGHSSDWPSKKLQQTLLLHFPNAKNIEWSRYDNYAEAIFYDDNIEKIARFTNDGLLSDYRVNLPIAEIPEIIADTIRNRHEVMNCIAIFIGDNPTYEIIARNSQLTRFLMIFNSNGEIIRQSEL